MESRVDFENLEQKAKDVFKTKQYEKLVEKVKNAEKIFILGNGGLHFVASHMSTDLTRLIPDKVAYSFDNFGFITSNANDYGFESVFVRWLETTAMTEDPEKCIILGLSCSGNSSNVVNALSWGDATGFETFLISGQKSQTLEKGIDELCCECEYFHTVEVLSLILFYDLIYQCGNKCPSINDEKVRLKDSSLRL